MKKQLQIGCLFVACVNSSGCASMATRGFADIGKPTPIYPGVTLLTTEWIPSYLDDKNPSIHDLYELPLSVVDLPLSATLDTLFLPLDIYDYSQSKKEEIVQSGTGQHFH
jgi:uncharacterized protein YceK